DDDAADMVENGASQPVGLRTGGPWDADEIVVPADDPSYLDLGGLLVGGRENVEVRVASEPEASQVSAVMLASEESLVEIVAFAASRSGGLWDDVRAEIAQQVHIQQGDAAETEGTFGAELQVQVPAQTPDGKPAVQPSRVVGIDGPRWLLRATFMGAEALQPAPDGVLEQALRDVVVVRGSDAMAPREQIMLRL